MLSALSYFQWAALLLTNYRHIEGVKKLIDNIISLTDHTQRVTVRDLSSTVPYTAFVMAAIFHRNLTECQRPLWFLPDG